DDKENMSYNSCDPLASSLFIEYNNNNNSLTWGDKVELELNALKDTTNIWNNSFTEYSRKDKEAIQKPSTSEINLEPTLDVVRQVKQITEQEITQDPVKKKNQDTISLQREMPHHAPTLDTVIDNIEINMGNTEIVAQTPMECSVEEENQVTMGALDIKNNTVIQQNSLGVSSIPDHMQGNENLQDELDTLSPTSNVIVRSNEYLEFHLSETATDATKPEDIEWLQLEGFTPVVNKNLAVSKKNKLIDKSMSQGLENRQSP
ncbi:10846_t:CDS:2, partial [Gigaspora margarita]